MMKKLDADVIRLAGQTVFIAAAVAFYALGSDLLAGTCIGMAGGMAVPQKAKEKTDAK
jgi:hypothetical protein